MWKLQAQGSYLLLMHLTITSTNLLYMCCFKYIFRTFFLPSSPICSLTDRFSSKYRRFCARTGFPGRPVGWRRPVTLCSTISSVPPASVPSTYTKEKRDLLHYFLISNIGASQWKLFNEIQSWVSRDKEHSFQLFWDI